MRRRSFENTVNLAFAVALLVPTACTDPIAAPPDDAVRPRNIDLGDAELFGPVLSDDLMGVLNKCMPSGQQFWLVYADDGSHLSISFAGESTAEAVTCVQDRLLLLGLAVLVEDTGEGTSTGGDTTG